LIFSLPSLIVFTYQSTKYMVVAIHPRVPSKGWQDVGCVHNRSSCRLHQRGKLPVSYQDFKNFQRSCT